MKELLWPEKTVTVELQDMSKGVAMPVTRKEEMTEIVELPATTPRCAKRLMAIDDVKQALEAPTAG